VTGGPAPEPAAAEPEPLVEARARLAAVDELPLEQRPAEFAAIDDLLRAALETVGGTRPGVPR
jgi:hypothetical protein